MNSPDETLLLKNQICFPLYAASRMLTKLYQPMLSRLDITYPQYLVLLVLWEKDERSVSEISTILYLESNTLTPLLKRLEKKEFIQRRRSADDERQVNISLTTEGSKLRDEAQCIPEQIFSQLQSEKMSASEVGQFKESLFDYF